MQCDNRELVVCHGIKFGQNLEISLYFDTVDS